MIPTTKNEKQKEKTTNSIIEGTNKLFLKNGWKDIGEIKRIDKSSHQIIIGKKYNRLTAIELHCLNERGLKLYRFKCDCGVEKIMPGFYVNLGRIKSCGCLRKEASSRIGKLARHNPGEAVKHILYNDYKRTAKKRKLSFELSLEVFLHLIEMPCRYCGNPPSNKKTSKRHFGSALYSGLDRVDNTKGYIEGNVVSCCKICNLAKRDTTLESFKAWIENVYKTTILSH